MASKKTLLRFDWAIKRLLRNKANFTVLEGFLSVLLNEEVKIVYIKESDGNQEHADDKFNRVDIFVEDCNGELIIIEMQNNPQVDYYLRMLYGVSKAITEHISLGDSYEKVRKVYHINILYFRLGDGGDYVYHGITEFRGIHSREVLQLTQKQKEFFQREKVMELFPEYYILCVEDFDNVAKDSLDEWIYYLKNTEIPESFTAPGLKEARVRLQYDQLTEEEKSAYRHHLKQTRYEQDVVSNSYNEGRAEGRKEMKEILAQKDQALEAERLEMIKFKTDMVIFLHKSGMPPDKIAEATGLTNEDIIKIIKNI